MFVTWFLEIFMQWNRRNEPILYVDINSAHEIL